MSCRKRSEDFLFFGPTATLVVDFSEIKAWFEAVVDFSEIKAVFETVVDFSEIKAWFETVVDFSEINGRCCVDSVDLLDVASNRAS